MSIVSGGSFANGLQTYTGTWINWSHGRILGTTLTLSQRDGGLFASFLAIFVTLAGGMFWKTLSFALHQANAVEPEATNRDALHQNRQAILRNSAGGAGGAAWSLLNLIRTWRGKLPKSTLRCFPFALVAILNVASFGIAGIFTSEITKTPGNSTLLFGPACGGYNLAPLTTNNSGISSSKDLADTNVAATYVRQCYGNTTSNGACGTYIRHSIPFKTNTNATCPFQSGTCLISDQDAFAMDTGFLDSQKDFGINAPQASRIQFRRVTTCAPLHSRQFGSYTYDNESVIGAKLSINAGPTAVDNSTFTYYTRTFLYQVAYTLSSIISIATPLPVPQWTPVEELFRKDAEVTLMMLAQNTVEYIGQSDDPWMPAHRSSDLLPGMYQGDFDVNLLACTDQYQICNPSKSNKMAGCTSLTSAYYALGEALITRKNEIGFNLDQQATVHRFMDTSVYRTMFHSVTGRGATALNAQETLDGLFQAAIPNNQWQKEVSIWFATSLAKEQAWAVEWATQIQNVDLSNPAVNSTFLPTPPNTPQLVKQCRNQLVRNFGTYMNFSVLGIGLIVGLGGLIIVVGLCVDSVIDWLREKRGWNAWKGVQWRAEETLRLQRAAYEGRGLWRDDGTDLPSSDVFAGKDVGQGGIIEKNLDKERGDTVVDVREVL